MKRRHNIIAACQDAGGCNAIYPVIRRMRRDGHSINLYASLYSASILRRKQEAFSEISPDNFNSIGNIVDKENTDLILTGTSLGFSIEDVFIEEGGKRRIPSIAVFDSWVNYAVRFADTANGRPFRYLPDYICVSDESVQSDMEKENIPAERIVVTGNPYFDNLLEEITVYTPDAKRRFLVDYSIPSNTAIASFFSQKIDKIFGADAWDKDFLGYTQFDALGIFIRAMERFYKGREAVLIVRPHPKEDKLNYIHFEKDNGSLRIIISNEEESREILAISDIVAGMFSIALVEAYILGKNILSIQPSLKWKDPFILSRLGLVRTLYTFEEVLNQINEFKAEVALDSRKVLNMFRVGKSTDNIANFIYNTLKT